MKRKVELEGVAMLEEHVYSSSVEIYVATLYVERETYGDPVDEGTEVLKIPIDRQQYLDLKKQLQSPSDKELQVRFNVSIDLIVE